MKKSIILYSLILSVGMGRASRGEEEDKENISPFKIQPLEWVRETYEKEQLLLAESSRLRKENQILIQEIQGCRRENEALKEQLKQLRIDELIHTLTPNDSLSENPHPNILKRLTKLQEAAKFQENFYKIIFVPPFLKLSSSAILTARSIFNFIADIQDMEAYPSQMKLDILKQRHAEIASLYKKEVRLSLRQKLFKFFYDHSHLISHSIYPEVRIEQWMDAGDVYTLALALQEILQTLIQQEEKNQE